MKKIVVVVESGMVEAVYTNFGGDFVVIDMDETDESDRRFIDEHIKNNENFEPVSGKLTDLIELLKEERNDDEN